jgi:ketosteroid isomerase-like protein
MTDTTPAMNAAAAAIDALVHRETRAWDARDVGQLLSLFHPDMVWPWPPDARAHDPADWVFVLGRFDPQRWGRAWQELFATHDLVHNRRAIRRIAATAEGDGGFAVVDVDTLWRHRETGAEQRWRGRACKIYTTVGGEWKLIAHTGLLDYGSEA